MEIGKICGKAERREKNRGKKALIQGWDECHLD